MSPRTKEEANSWLLGLTGVSFLSSGGLLTIDARDMEVPGVPNSSIVQQTKEITSTYNKR